MAEFQQVYRGGRVNMRLWLDVPKRPEFIAQPRHWNKIVKDSIRDTLIHHHNKNMPRHFSREARTRYSHKPRNDKYKAWKKRRFGSITDLVMSGRTKNKITAASGYDKITIGGAAEGGKKAVSGQLWYSFGFSADIKAHYQKKSSQSPQPGRSRDPRAQKQRRQNPNRVTMQDMRAELQRITPDEADALRDVFLASLNNRIEQIRAGRKRVGRR